jgi:hypothetical protein
MFSIIRWATFLSRRYDPDQFPNFVPVEPSHQFSYLLDVALGGVLIRSVPLVQGRADSRPITYSMIL